MLLHCIDSSAEGSRRKEVGVRELHFLTVTPPPAPTTSTHQNFRLWLCPDETVRQECHRDKSLLVHAGTALHRVAEGRIPRGSNKYRCEVISRAPRGAHHGPVKDVWAQPPQPAGSFGGLQRPHPARRPSQCTSRKTKQRRQYQKTFTTTGAKMSLSFFH